MEYRMTSDRTMHPYFLSTVNELDDTVRPYAEEYLGDHSQPVSIFVSPANMYPRNYRFRLIPQKVLIFSRKGVMQIGYSEKRGGKPTISCLEAEDILLVKNSMYLLYGKLEIWSKKTNASPVIDIEYNTVAHDSLRPYIQTLIEHSWKTHPDPEIHLTPDDSYEKLFNISYSFYNGILTEGLHKDERILSVIFQPEISKKYLKYLSKKLSPTTCLAFTDRQLIVLQQDIRYRVHHEWLFSFFPWFYCGNLNISRDEFGSRCQIEIGMNYLANFLFDSRQMEELQGIYSKWRPGKTYP
ncbi:MAG: hypothetical protein GYA14_09995 [Ignavibacteria bacterium]|nr:hypothetical protein [Ignavibacteria bacterium]